LFVEPPTHQGPRGATTLTSRGAHGEAAFAPVAGGAVPLSQRGGAGGGQQINPQFEGGGGVLGYAYANDEESVSALALAESQPQSRASLINVQDLSNGTTALFWAAFAGHAKMVELLLRFGANVDLANHRGDSPLHAACYARKDAVVKVLLEKGNANLRARDFVDELTALHVAAYMGHVPSLIAICADEDIDELLALKDRDGMTPLHMAVIGQSVEAVKYLLSYYLNNDLDLNVRDSSGMTPLSWACSLNHTYAPFLPYIIIIIIIIIIMSCSNLLL